MGAKHNNVSECIFYQIGSAEPEKVKRGMAVAVGRTFYNLDLNDRMKLEGPVEFAGIATGSI